MLAAGGWSAFYHHLFLSDTTIIGLLDELGLKDRLIWEDSTVGYFTHGRIFPFATAKDLYCGSAPLASWTAYAWGW